MNRGAANFRIHEVRKSTTPLASGEFSNGAFGEITAGGYSTRRPLGGRCGASVLPSGIEDLPRGLDRTPAAGLIFSRRQSAACVVLRLRLRLRARHLGRLLGRLPPPRRDLPAQPAVAGDGHRWGYGPGGLMHPVATLSISAPADLTRAEAGTRWPMQEFLRPAARPRAGSRSVTQDLEPMIIGERSARFDSVRRRGGLSRRAGGVTGAAIEDVGLWWSCELQPRTDGDPDDRHHHAADRAAATAR